MTKPTVSKILSDIFGSDFSGATQDQRLLLLEAVALSLRTGGWQHKLRLVCSRVRASQRPPEDCFLPLELNRNEGLKLLAVLNVAIVEHYSVEAFSKITAEASPAATQQAIGSVVENFSGSEGVNTEPPDPRTMNIERNLKSA
jgi:hypothetical protein